MKQKKRSRAASNIVFRPFIPNPDILYKVEFYTKFKSGMNLPIDTMELRIWEADKLTYYAPLRPNDNDQP